MAVWSVIVRSSTFTGEAEKGSYKEKMQKEMKQHTEEKKAGHMEAPFGEHKSSQVKCFKIQRTAQGHIVHTDPERSTYPS